jgi:DHA3 family macrolide efflux protein-like MFS transporter
MNRNTMFYVGLFIAAEASVNVSVRSFQIFITWYFLKLESQASGLSNVLLAAWITSTALLPISGVIANRVRKKMLLLTASCLVAMCITCTFVIVQISTADLLRMHIIEFSVAISILLSVGTALIFPLGTPLIVHITSNENEIHRAMRWKSSMFIVNLIFGPTLAGIMISYAGGFSVVYLALFFAFVGVVVASGFSFLVREDSPKNPADNSRSSSFFSELKGGLSRVLEITEERTIAMSSMFANMVLVPFIFLALPTKVLGIGMSMLQLALIELSLGVGVLFASSYGIQILRRHLSQHKIATIGLAMLAVSIFAFAFIENIFVMGIFGAAIGFGLIAFNATVNTKRAVSIPKMYLSNMESALLFLCTISAPLGLWLAGRLLETHDANAVIACSVALFLPTVLIIWFSKSLKCMLNATASERPYYEIKYEKLFN